LLEQCENLLAGKKAELVRESLVVSRMVREWVEATTYHTLSQWVKWPNIVGPY
jgi:hypothetical protein